MKILFFGQLREAAGCAELACTPPTEIQTVEALRDWLGGREPALAEAIRRSGIRVARDQSFCGFDAPIAGAKEIAFMSPLSGG